MHVRSFTIDVSLPRWLDQGAKNTVNTAFANLRMGGRDRWGWLIDNLSGAERDRSEKSVELMQTTYFCLCCIKFAPAGVLIGCCLRLLILRLQLSHTPLVSLPSLFDFSWAKWAVEIS